MQFGICVMADDRCAQRDTSTAMAEPNGVEVVRLPNDRMYLAELHWYEAHGIGKNAIKIKRLLEEAD